VTPAGAHIGAPEGRVPFVSPDGLTGGGTTWGIVNLEQGCWMRTCEEALNGPPGFYYRQPTGDRIVLGRSDGVWFTDDFGCTLTPGDADLADKNPQVFIASRSAPAVLYVATADPTGGNGVFKSTDDGETFEPTGLADLNVSFRSLAVSPDGSMLWVTGLDLDTRVPLLWVSADGGVSFTPQTPWPQNTAFATLIGFDEDVGQPAISIIDDTGVGSAVSLVSADATMLTEIGTFEGVASDFTAFNGRYLVIQNRATFHVREKTANTFTEIDGPSRCLLRLPGDDTTVWGCGQPFQQGHYLTSEDGETWTPVLPFLDVIERQCPDGTLGAERCAYLFAADAGPQPMCMPDGGVIVPPVDAGAPTDAGPEEERDAGGVISEPPPNGCPCSSTDSADAPLALVLAGAWLLARRRRRR
jgi:MYXO-CTERM domain-containing protein